MRATLTLFSLLTLVFAEPAAAQWQVRPAPPSWGLPSGGLPSGGLPTVPSSQPPSAPAAALTGETGLQQALSCSAALQLASMAAPTWARERGVAAIANGWLQRVFALGEQNGLSGDRLPALIEAEMQRQTDTAAADPAALSRRAFDCASSLPS